MLYLPTLNRLLGLPEDLTEPNPYELLALDRGEHVREAVQKALEKRKVLLRIAVPGPQFVPLVERFDQELDLAALELLDAGKRNALDRRLLAEEKAEPMKRKRVVRQRAILALRKTIAACVEDDGTLNEQGRSALAEKLRGHGADAATVAAVLTEIPEPLSEDAPLSPETKDFFVETAQLAYAVRDDAGLVQRELFALAERLRVPEVQAQRILDRTRPEAQAGGDVPDSEKLAAWFEQEVRKLYPEGDADKTEREALMDLAAAEGLGPVAAQHVIQKCLNPLPGEAYDVGVASTTTQTLPRLSWVREKQHAEGPQRRSRLWLACVLVPAAAAALTVGVIVALGLGTPRRTRPKLPDPPAPKPRTVWRPSRPETEPPVKPHKPPKPEPPKPEPPKPEPPKPEPPKPEPPKPEPPKPEPPVPDMASVPPPPMQLVDAPAEIQDIRNCFAVETEVAGELCFNVGQASAVLTVPLSMDPYVRFRLKDNVLTVSCPPPAGFTWRDLLEVRLTRRKDGALNLIWKLEANVEGAAGSLVNHLVMQVVDVKKNIMYRCRKTGTIPFTVVPLAYDEEGNREKEAGTFACPWPKVLKLRCPLVNNGAPVGLGDIKPARKSLTLKMLLKNAQIHMAQHDVDLRLVFTPKPNSVDITVESDEIETLLKEHNTSYKAVKQRVSARGYNARKAARKLNGLKRDLTKAQADHRRAELAADAIRFDEWGRRVIDTGRQRRINKAAAKVRSLERRVEKAKEEKAEAEAAVTEAQKQLQATPTPEKFARDTFTDLSHALRNAPPIRVIDAWDAPVAAVKVMVKQQEEEEKDKEPE